MNIIFIHGANATSVSFNYIKLRLTEYINNVFSMSLQSSKPIQNVNINFFDLEYSDHKGFDYNLANMFTFLAPKEDMFIISHSLGGIYAVHLANLLKKKVIGGVSISTPYGGSQSATYLKYLTFWQNNLLLHDIGPYSKPIINAQKIKLDVPWVNVVTTGGSVSLLNEPNDSVITVKSMKAKKDIDYISLDLNHFEVLQSNELIKIIEERINRLNYV